MNNPSPFAHQSTCPKLANVHQNNVNEFADFSLKTSELVCFQLKSSGFRHLNQSASFLLELENMIIDLHLVCETHVIVTVFGLPWHYSHCWLHWESLMKRQCTPYVYLIWNPFHKWIFLLKYRYKVTLVLTSKFKNTVWTLRWFCLVSLPVGRLVSIGSGQIP